MLGSAAMSTDLRRALDTAKTTMDYYFYSLYALATSHDTSNLTNAEHNEYARFIEALQQEDCQ